MSNIDKITSIVDQLSMVANFDGITTSCENMYSSICWGAASQLINGHARTLQINESLSGATGATKERLLDQLHDAEARIASAEDIIAWSRVQANQEFLPEADEAVALFATPIIPNPDDIKAAAEQLGISLAEARRAQLAAGAELLDTIQENQEALLKILEAALAAEPRDFELDTQQALRLVSKVAAKCEQYMLRKEVTYFRTRRPSVRQQIAADRKILESVMKAADAQAVIWQHEVDSDPGTEEIAKAIA
jgi:hypothetical protein